MREEWATDTMLHRVWPLRDGHRHAMTPCSCIRRRFGAPLELQAINMISCWRAKWNETANPYAIVIAL